MSNAKNRKLFSPTTLAVLVAIIMLLLPFFLRKQAAHPTVRVGKHSYEVEVANTTSKREQGLSGRASLPQNTAMLFVFDKPDQACFWMKDMKFPLDIVWIQEDKVVKVSADTSQNTYPQNFCPDQPVPYVLELNTGSGIRVGDKAQINL